MMQPKTEPISYITEQEAVEIYELLMAPFGFSVDQLMELAGLSVANAIAEHLRLVSTKSYHQIHKTSPALVSIDIPSGWHVEEGDINGDGIKPDMLVSLAAPKLRAKKFFGQHHFLSWRFLPPSIVENFKLQLPHYPGTSMCVRIEKPPAVDVSAPRENYTITELLKERVEADPFDQFQAWFHIAVAAGIKEPNYMALSTADRVGKLIATFVSVGAPVMKIEKVRVEGSVEKVSDEESEQCFLNLPREIQIRPIVSKQSTVIPARQVLHQQYKELKEEYAEGSFIPRPKYWGGYRLKPEYFEFWHGEESRVHLKLRYSVKDTDTNKEWKIDRLSK